MALQSKKEIRERILTLLRNQNKTELLEKSLVIEKNLFQQQLYRDAKTIVFYAAINGEVFTFNMIKKALSQGKVVGLPKVIKGTNQLQILRINSIEEDLETGQYGIQEPKQNLTAIDNNTIDVVIVPAVCFDKDNNRLGRGKGFYDRFLAELPPKASSIGLAFDFQIVDQIFDLAPHDIPVSVVVTN